MKKTLEYIIFIVCLVCISCFSGSVAGQEDDDPIVTSGKIIEIAAEEHIIQVKDRNFVVTSVYIDDGLAETEPEPAFFSDLKVGSIVDIHVGPRNDDGFLIAKKVIILTGDDEDDPENP